MTGFFILMSILSNQAVNGPCTIPKEISLDSGASFHMPCYRDCLADYKRLEPPMLI